MNYPVHPGFRTRLYLEYCSHLYWQFVTSYLIKCSGREDVLDRIGGGILQHSAGRWPSASIIKLLLYIYIQRPRRAPNAQLRILCTLNLRT